MDKSTVGNNGRARVHNGPKMVGAVCVAVVQRMLLQPKRRKETLPQPTATTHTWCMQHNRN